MNPISFGTNMPNAMPPGVVPPNQTNSASTTVSNLQNQVDKANQLGIQELNKNNSEKKIHNAQTADTETKKESEKKKRKKPNLNFEQSEAKTDSQKEKKNKLINNNQVSSKKEEVDKSLPKQEQIQPQRSTEEQHALCKRFFDPSIGDDLAKFKELFFEYAPQSSTLKDPLGYSLLHITSMLNKIEFVEFLIEQKVDMEAKNYNGLTALCAAIQYGMTDVALLLIEKNAQIDSKNLDGITPVHLASKYGREKILLKMVSIIKNKAVESRNCIGESSVDSFFNIEDHWKQTPLHYAVVYKQGACMQILIENGAKIDQPDALNMTPFLSGMSRNAPCISALLEHPLFLKDPKHLSACNKDGDNAIHFAVRKMSQKELSEFLQKLSTILSTNNSASNQIFSDMINKENNLGITPYSLTLDSDLKKVLVEHGARRTWINKRQVECKICTNILFHALYVTCGHPVCRVCFHTWKTKTATETIVCQTCKQETSLVEGYNYNFPLDKLLKTVFSDEIAKREASEQQDPLACMLRNLDVLGKALKRSLVLTSNNTCILKINNDFLLTIVYANRSAYLISPLLSVTVESLEDAIALQVYQTLLDLLNNGWVHARTYPNEISCYVNIFMEDAPDTQLLAAMREFIRFVSNWRAIMSHVVYQKPRPLNHTPFSDLAHLTVSPDIEAQIEKSFKTLNNPSLNTQTIGLGPTLSSDSQYVVNKQSSPWTFQDTKNKISFIIMHFPVSNKIRFSTCLISGLPSLSIKRYRKLLSRFFEKGKTEWDTSSIEGVFSISNSDLMFHMSVNIRKDRNGKITEPSLNSLIPFFIDQVLSCKNFINKLKI